MLRIISSIISFIAVVSIITAAKAADSGIPNASLKVTVRQKENGKLESGFHVLELFCWNGQCSLTSVSLNQCGESGSGKKAFYPKAQHSSTKDGNLVVKNVADTLIVQETGADIGGTYTNNLRFQYEPSKKGETITRLHGFSGGFVKDSAVLGKILTIEYVPLKGSWQVLPLECGVLAPGID